MVRPFTVPLVLLGACLFGAPSGARAQTAEEIVAANIAASGGEEAIGRIKNIRNTGRVVVESPLFGKLEGTLEAVRVPGRRSYEHVVLGPIQQTEGWDGTRGWERGPTGLRTLEGVELATLEVRFFVNAFVALRTLARPGLRIERREDAAVGGRPHYVLAVKTADAPTVTMYIDRQTNLVTRTSATMAIPNMGEMPVVTDVGGYQVVAGVRLPTTLTQVVEGLATTRITLEETVVDTAVDAAIFTPPASAAAPASPGSAPKPAPPGGAATPAPRATTVAAAPLAGRGGPRFEVASIRPSGDLSQQSKGGLTITQRQARFSLPSLNDYIGIAFGLPLHRIAGPEWLASTRFEIAATIPENQPAGQVQAMLRTLLEERFKMRTHREDREFAVYALEAAAGGSTLVAAVPDALKPLGLSLTPRRAPLEVLAIDSMEKLPTEMN